MASFRNRKKKKKQNKTKKNKKKIRRRRKKKLNNSLRSTAAQQNNISTCAQSILSHNNHLPKVLPMVFPKNQRNSLKQIKTLLRICFVRTGQIIIYIIFRNQIKFRSNHLYYI
jgi:hypothetical protein